MDEEQELPQQVADLAEASVPNSVREIRACKRCGILKTFDQFVSFGMYHKAFIRSSMHHIVVLGDMVGIPTTSGWSRQMTRLFLFTH